MVAASKFFQWPINHIHCSQVPLHQGRTCFQSFFYDLYRFTISAVPYYSPLVLVPLFIKREKMDKTAVFEIVRFYFETVFSSSITTSVVFGLICLFRNLRSKFTIFYFVLPLYLGCQTCWFFPKRSLKIFSMATTQVALEIILKEWKNPFAYLLLNSKALKTLWFMLSSAVLMHYKRNLQYNGFWFIQPELKVSQIADTKGASGESTTTTTTVSTSFQKKFDMFRKFLLKGTKTYLTYGLSLDILSAVLKTKLPRKFRQAPSFILQALKNTNLKMTCFFMTYIGLYRLALHYLSNSANKAELTDLQHFSASFIGGLSYAFVNKLTFNTFAFVLAIQVLWQQFCQTPHSEGTKQGHLLETLKKLPFSKILFPFSTACIISSFIFFNDSVNGLGRTLLFAVTDKKIQRIHEFITKNTEDFILRTAATVAPLGVF